jgi:hypothetical protein
MIELQCDRDAKKALQISIEILNVFVVFDRDHRPNV